MKKLYEEGRKKDPEVFKDDVRLSASKARTVVSYLESINFSETDLDSKGRAFETFMGSFFRGDFGQYFTPRPIVKFIVDVLPHYPRIARPLGLALLRAVYPAEADTFRVPVV